jgi:hypothetical protein
MIENPSLFDESDPEEVRLRTPAERAEGARDGALRREEAVGRVGANVHAAWSEAALAAVRKCAETLYTFCADQPWEILDALDVVGPHEPRAMGAVLRTAVARGWIVATDEYVPSTRPEAHRGPKRVWRSLLRPERNL